MKKMLIHVSAIMSACAMNATIGDVIGGAIDNSIDVVRDVAHSASHYVRRDHPHFIPMSGANEAFGQRYDAALEQIRELENKNVLLDQKKQNISRIILLSNEMVDSLAPSLFAQQVQDLRTYVSNEAKRIRDLQSVNDFNGAANAAYALIDYLRSFE